MITWRACYKASSSAVCGTRKYTVLKVHRICYIYSCMYTRVNVYVHVILYTRKWICHRTPKDPRVCVYRRTCRFFFFFISRFKYLFGKKDENDRMHGVCTDFSFPWEGKKPKVLGAEFTRVGYTCSRWYTSCVNVRARAVVSSVRLNTMYTHVPRARTQHAHIIIIIW